MEGSGYSMLIGGYKQSGRQGTDGGGNWNGYLELEGIIELPMLAIAPP
jgi:hypothetical protein